MRTISRVQPYGNHIKLTKYIFIGPEFRRKYVLLKIILTIPITIFFSVLGKAWIKTWINHYYFWYFERPFWFTVITLLHLFIIIGVFICSMIFIWVDQTERSIDVDGITDSETFLRGFRHLSDPDPIKIQEREEAKRRYVREIIEEALSNFDTKDVIQAIKDLDLDISLDENEDIR
ncbi:MAG: hypothetical protein QXS37_05170 [Candidatus Aenigmatarchaeota archaeon]